MKQKKIIVWQQMLSILIVGVLFIGGIPLAQTAPLPPVLPTKFNGFVTISNQSAPDGTLISAFVNGQLRKTVETFTYNAKSAYVIEVEQGDDGDLITFTISGDPAFQTALFTSGKQYNYFNLSTEKVNHPPVITSTPVTTAVENQTYLYDVEAYDPDNDTLHYSLPVHPIGMIINISSGLIMWTTSGHQIGNHNVTVQVSDGNLSTNQSYIINVSRQQYLITTLADGSLKKNLTFTGPQSITDYLSIPRNATVHSATMNLTGYPISQQTTVFRDDFNDGDLAGWTVNTQGSGIIQISGAQYHSSPYSLRMYSPQGTSSLAMATNTIPFNPATTDYNVSFYFRLTSSPNHWFDVFVNVPQILTVIETGNVFTYRYGTTNVAVMTFAINQWYRIQYIVHVAQGNYEILVDGVYKATAPFCGGGGNPQTFTIGDFESSSANYGEAYWDDFVIIPLIMSDDFNDNNLNGWTVTTSGSGVVQTTSSQYHSAPYSMRMYSPTTAAMAKATYTMSALNIANDYNVTFYFRMPATSHHWFDVFTNPPHTTTVIDSSYQFKYRYSGINILIMTLTPNTWYRMDYYVHPSQQTYDIYVNYIFRATAPFNGDAGNPQLFRIGDFESESSNYGEGFWDDFVVIQLPTTQSYPLNPWLDVGNDGDHQWDHAGSFSTKETVSDFSEEINQYLSTQPPGEGNVQVPLVFHSDAAGKIEISGIRIIYTLPSGNRPPVAPSNPTPAAGATGILVNTSLTWVCSDPDNDPTTYDVYFGTSTPPPKTVSNQSGTIYDPPGDLLFNTKYYWKIVAWDNQGAFSVGPIWNFTTKINTPPYTPYSPNPANNTLNVNISKDISWTGGDPDPEDTVKYDVFFGTTSPPPKQISNQTGTTYDPGTMTYNTTYYWKIIAWDNHNASTLGPVWKFTTELRPNQPPNTPIKPIGPTIIYKDIQYTYQTSTIDPDNDSVYYLWDWGDGNISGWLGPYQSGANCSTAHTWTTLGTKNIKVQAKDTMAALSNWSENLTIQVITGFYLNLADFPMYSAESQPGYKQMCGPAVAQMTLNYMWWNSSQYPQPPLTFASQTWLYQRGRENNSNTSLPYFDTIGMWRLIQAHMPKPYTQYGYNFNKYSTDNASLMLKWICEWINYTVGTYGGHQPGHPYNVPGAIPIYANYSNWVAVRGFNSDKPAFPLPDTLTVYGFWVNDPYPASLGGMGENSYKTTTTWLTSYQKPMMTDDQYNGKYVGVLEPPETNEHTQIIIPISPARFNQEEQRTLKQIQTTDETRTPDEDSIPSDQWIIRAAIQGVTEQLLPYDTEFATLFKQTTPGTPLFIHESDGTDYYAVPFNIVQKKSEKPIRSLTPSSSTSVTMIVILIDADNGSFMEASWVKKPVTYLPISEEQAKKIIIDELEKLGFEVDPNKMMIDLLHRQSTPYYPDWRIVIEEYGLQFFVGQDGKIKDT